MGRSVGVGCVVASRDGRLRAGAQLGENRAVLIADGRRPEHRPKAEGLGHQKPDLQQQHAGVHLHDSRKLLPRSKKANQKRLQETPDPVREQETDEIRKS